MGWQWWGRQQSYRGHCGVVHCIRGSTINAQTIAAIVAIVGRQGPILCPTLPPVPLSPHYTSQPASTLSHNPSASSKTSLLCSQTSPASPVIVVLFLDVVGELIFLRCASLAFRWPLISNPLIDSRLSMSANSLRQAD